MLKKFFISMLGSMAALWLSLLIFVICSVFFITAILAKNIGGTASGEASILYLDLTGTIPDRESDASMYDILSAMDASGDDLTTILGSIRAAADDKNIKGIYIYCGGSQLGVASRGEVLDALKQFKKTGKWVYAYADDYTQGDYYIASVADKVYLNPVGTLTVSGLTSQVMFFKDLLEKLGVGITVVKVGSFKSAVEPFIRMDMSEPSKLQTSLFLTQIWEVMRDRIAENRGIDNPQEINSWADSLCFTWDPKRYVDHKMVSELSYRADVEDMLRGLTDTDSKADLPTITPTEYMSTKISSLKAQTSKHVAVLYAIGDIVQAGDGGIVGETMVPEIRKLAQDDNVAGLVLRVNSGGGSAYASEQIWKALEDFKGTGKPFYVSMGDYAASGGYYISCGADSIYCDPATLTGSIGIFGIIPNFERLVKSKIGLGVENVSTNPGAVFPDPYTAPTTAQVDAMQAYVERGYETFTTRVAQGRNMPIDSVKAIGGGRVWDGITAHKIGLVDGIANLNQVVTKMANKCKVSEDAVVAYPVVELSVLNTLLKQTRKNISVDIEGINAEDVKAVAEAVNQVRNMDPLQARMETIVLR